MCMEACQLCAGISNIIVWQSIMLVLQDIAFRDGHVISGTLDGLIERLVPLPNYYPDVSLYAKQFSSEIIRIKKKKS